MMIPSLLFAVTVNFRRKERNTTMKQKHRRLRIILLALAVIIAVTLAVNHRAVRLVFRNLTVPTYDLDESRDWNGGAVYMEVPYSDVSPSDYVNIYVPDGVENPPLYVVIHGGGFIANDAESRQARLMYRYFRDHGFACATVNYRLAGEAPFPAAVEDCKAAIRFLRAHADEYGYNADRIAVFGESAGGYLAVMCAVTNDGEFNGLAFIGQDELGDVSAKVDVLVDYYGCVELGMDKDISAIGLPSAIYRIANSWASRDVLQGFENVESFWLRKNLSEMTEEELSVSAPYTYINENLPGNSGLSVWIVHGDCDITVPYLQSTRLNDRLTGLLGADRVTFRLIPNMGHASDPLYSDEELGLLEEYLKDKMLDR